MTMKPSTNGHENESQQGAELDQLGLHKESGKEISPKNRASRKDYRRTRNRSKQVRKNNKETIVSQTVEERAAEHIVASAHQASRATSAVGDAIEDGVRVARRAARKGGDAAEEFLNDTTRRVQRHPLVTVAAGFAGGLAVGAMIGWMMKRR
jgi:hypothetical protein